MNARCAELEAEAATLDDEKSAGKDDARAQKYKDLEAKDKQMAVFLDTFDES